MRKRDGGREEDGDTEREKAWTNRDQKLESG